MNIKFMEVVFMLNVFNTVKEKIKGHNKEKVLRARVYKPKHKSLKKVRFENNLYKKSTI